MKKVCRNILCVAGLGLIAAFTGCGGASGENEAPQITGVCDQVIEAGSEFDAMADIAAMDKEDGDITNKIVIEATPSLEFVNGKAVVDKAGSYELTYSVTDKAGETVSEYATLTVTKQAGELELYKSFDFGAEDTVDSHGWEARIAEGAQAEASLKQGAFVFDITNPGEGDGDIQLVKSGMELKAANYCVKVWAKSTADTYCHMLAIDANSEEWKTFGGEYNLVIGQEIQPLVMNFTSETEGAADIAINLGKITPNPDNAADTTPENFSVIIDKIEIYEITGVENKEPVYTCDFGENNDSVTVEAGDGAEASVNTEGAANVFISSYPTEGGVWSIKANIGLGENAIEAGNKYYYSFTVLAESDQSGECLVESASEYDKARANFSNFTAKAGELTTVSGVFVAENSVSDPVVRLQIGNPSDGVSSNTLVIDDVEFGAVTGNLTTDKTIDSFSAYNSCNGRGNNNDFQWTVYNGTDEDNDRGVGALYLEDGKLCYRIDQGGIVDWHNKLICGYGDNPITLESDSYYTIEIVCKASKDVSGMFFLNPSGSWDPRISETLNITTEEQTFTLTTTDVFITDMNFEMLFQFGSEDTAALGDVTIEISDVNIYKQSVIY